MRSRRVISGVEEVCWCWQEGDSGVATSVPHEEDTTEIPPPSCRRRRKPTQPDQLEAIDACLTAVENSIQGLRGEMHGFHTEMRGNFQTFQLSVDASLQQLRQIPQQQYNPPTP